MLNGSKHLSKPQLLAVAALFAALVAVCAAGCGGETTAPPPGAPGGDGEREIPLRTLAQGVMSEYGRVDQMPVPEDAPPECLVIEDAEGLQRLISLAVFQEPVADVDFGRYIVIAAMQGAKNTGGYAISIMHASQAGSEVRVEVDLVEPEPGAMTAQVLTSPYHLVLAERSAFDPRGELLFTFVDQDDNRISQQPAGV